MTLELRAIRILIAVMVVAGCSRRPPDAASVPLSAPVVSSIALPDAPPDGVFMDYLAYDRLTHRVWAPAGNTASVDVVDANSGRVIQIAGFAIAERELRGRMRTVGPSSATVGNGAVYVGNRADASVCRVDAVSLVVGACITLDAQPDGLAYVASTQEVWATMPADHSITVLDASGTALTKQATIRLDGQPEGYAVDDHSGRFYTNLEDKDRTVTIDVHSRQVSSTWPAGCGAEGPRGLALDDQLGFLLVACTDRVLAVDARHDGVLLSAIAVGGGLDNIDYVSARRELYAAAGRAATLTIARLDTKGQLTMVALVPTAPGARNAVATEAGTAYVADSPQGKLLVVAPFGSTPLNTGDRGETRAR
ncbi:MAG: hypothetical protein ABI629_07220 [bacterium]